MRAFLVAVAAVLIISGLIIAGVVTWWVWVDNRTATVDVAVATSATDTGTRGAAIETGGMSLQAAPPASSGRDPVVVIVPGAGPAAAAQEAAPADIPPEQPVPPVEEGCVATTVPGLPLDAAVYARGTVRLYNEPDVDAPTQGEFNAGAVFRIESTGEDGGTAVERCGLKWYRVRVSGASTIAVAGWVLADAVDVNPPEPPVTVTPGCTPQPQPCPGGCPQPPCQPNCWEPCVDPCCQNNPNPCECWDYPRG
jgi:hypothetical protein